MFRKESWKPIYFDVKTSKVKVTSRRNNAGVGLCTLVSVGFFWFPLVTLPPFGDCAVASASNSIDL